MTWDASARFAPYLSPRAADAAFGSWGLADWSRATAVPAALRFAGSCAAPLRDGTTRVLREQDDAAIRSVIARRAGATGAARSMAVASHRVRACISARPSGDGLGTVDIRNRDGRAQVFGVLLGDGRMAKKVEYVVIARSGRAVEVSTFHTFAQDVTPPSTVRDFGRRVLHRLASIG